MKKTVVLAALLSLVTASSALAEHKLLVTDVPEPGHVEARVDVAYSNLDGKLGGETVQDEKTAAIAAIGVGVAPGLKLSIALPYTMVQHEINMEAGKIIKKDGFGDLTLGARYALTKSLVKLPFDAAVGVDWKTTTASDGEENTGTGRNSYAPYVAVSKNLHIVIPYVKYQPEFVVKQHAGQTNHNLTLGAEIEFGHHYTLDVAAKYTAKGHGVDDAFGKEDVRSANDLELEVAPYIEVVKNLYILPKVAYKFMGGRTLVETGEKINKIDEYTLGLGVYYLF